MGANGRVTERTVQAALMRYVMDEKHHQLAVPNSTAIFRWEADLVSATVAGLMHEFEIKLTPSDYRRDFEKQWKHSVLRRPIRGLAPCYFWYVTCGFEIPDLPPYAGWLEYDPELNYPASRIVVKAEAPRLDGRRLAVDDYRTFSRLLSYRLKNLYGRLEEPDDEKQPESLVLACGDPEPGALEDSRR